MFNVQLTGKNVPAGNPIEHLILKKKTENGNFLAVYFNFCLK